MPTYRYVAKNKAGKIQRGNAEAADERSLTQQLQDADLWLVHADEAASGTTQEQTRHPDDERRKLLCIVAAFVIMAVIAWAVVR